MNSFWQQTTERLNREAGKLWELLRSCMNCLGWRSQWAPLLRPFCAHRAVRILFGALAYLQDLRSSVIAILTGAFALGTKGAGTAGRHHTHRAYRPGVTRSSRLEPRCQGPQAPEVPALQVTGSRSAPKMSSSFLRIPMELTQRLPLHGVIFLSTNKRDLERRCGSCRSSEGSEGLWFSSPPPP